jgi:LacI family transcriptional regulator
MITSGADRMPSLSLDLATHVAISSGHSEPTYTERRIILLVEPTSAYGRGCLRGIARYARGHGLWTFHHRTRYLMEPPDLQDLQAWRADGVIARIENRQMARVIVQLGLPTVDIRASMELPGVARVLTDDTKVVELALDHLRGNGLRHIAYCGFPGVDFSESRQAVFERLATGAAPGSRPVYRNRAAAPPVEMVSYEQRGALDAKPLRAWLKVLPKPIGIIACNDQRGRQILEACMAEDLKVPYEVAVVGVDDDDVVCELSNPRLTSVAPNVELVGFEAARLLDRRMAGEPFGDQPLLIPPIAIELRGSSDVTAIDDPTLVKAIRFIRSRIGEGINVKDVLAHVDVSRSTFERQFREHLGCTPYDYILRFRIDRVKQLLVDTNYPLSQVTSMAGFRGVAHMTAVFRARTGQTPGQYRRSTM